jgi:phage terminase large subunit-like protein
MKENTIYVSPVDGSYQVFNEGDPLWPERFGDYSNLRRSINNESIFRTQYLQEPSKESTYLKEEDFNYLNIYEASDIMEEPEFIYASHDFPIKDKETSDMLGSVLAYYKDHKLLIVDCFEQRMAYNASERWVKNLTDTTPMLTQIVEAKANGEIIIQRLQSIIPGLIAYDPKSNSKGQRLEIAVSRMVSKNVYFLLNEVNELSPNLKMLKDRLLSFPMVSNDDIVDAFSQLVIHAFEEKYFGIFTSAMSKYNVLERKPFFSRVNAAVTREGQLYKFLKFTYDAPSDSLWILEEETFYATEFDAITRLRELTTDVRAIIDASEEQVLYNAFMGKVRGLINYSDDRALSQKMTQIQLGIGAANIKWAKECVEFKRDLAICAYDKNALKDGIERLATREGFVACLRAAVYFYKGTSEFRILDQNRILQ